MSIYIYSKTLWNFPLFKFKKLATYTLNAEMKVLRYETDESQITKREIIFSDIIYHEVLNN